MPEKIIKQQPVTMDHVKHVVFIIIGAAGIDAITDYRPVDETDTPIGEYRSYTEHFTGPNAVRVRNFLTTEVIPDINDHEGTA